jgi:hypothetical protein
MFTDKSEKRKKLVALYMRTQFLLLITALFFCSKHAGAVQLY